MDNKHKKYPQNGGFPPIVTPNIFFKKLGSVTFVSYGERAITKDPFGYPGVQNKISFEN